MLLSRHHCLVPRQNDSSVSSEDMNGAEPTWVAAEQPPVPEPSPPESDPTAAVKEEDGKTSQITDKKTPQWQNLGLVLL